MGANRFAKIVDQYWLDLTFVSLMNPESLRLHSNGERSPLEAIAEAKRLQGDYAERCHQLATA